jgi:hypothetical protein
MMGQDRDLLPIPRSNGGQAINGPITMEMIRPSIWDFGQGGGI